MWSKVRTKATFEGKTREATKKVESFQHDLILMDIRLPDEYGLELTKKIEITTPNVKILILTDHQYPEYKEIAARYGADGFLVKGDADKEMLAMVESFFPKAKASTIAEKK